MSDQTQLDDQNNPPPIDDRGHEWFYVEKGARKGPVSVEVIKRLLKSKTLEPDDQVWRKGLKEWVAVRDSELGDFLGSEPPPVSGEHINNSLVWILALLPLVYVLIDAYLRVLPVSLFGVDVARMAYHLFPDRTFPWWLGGIINAIFAFWDERRLSNAGHGFGWMTFSALLLLPVYLFLRAKRLKQWPTYALTWVVALVASPFVLSALVR